MDDYGWLVWYMVIVGVVAQVIIAGILANNKNRSVGGWCLATLLFGPWMLGILLALRSVQGYRAPEPAPAAPKPAPAWVQPPQTPLHWPD